MITLTEYQKLSAATDMKQANVDGSKLMYYALGLVDETGEVFGKIKKLYRDYGGVVTDEWREGLKLELGDVLWYTTQILTYFDEDVQRSVMSSTGIDPLRLLNEVLFFSGTVYKFALMDAELMRLDIIDAAKWTIEYIADFAACYNLSIEEIAQANLDKLADRAKRGKIRGEGDNR